MACCEDCCYPLAPTLTHWPTLPLLALGAQAQSAPLLEERRLGIAHATSVPSFGLSAYLVHAALATFRERRRTWVEAVRGDKGEGEGEGRGRASARPRRVRTSDQPWLMELWE